MEALVLLMKKTVFLPALANRHGVEKSANGVNLNGSYCFITYQNKTSQEALISFYIFELY